MSARSLIKFLGHRKHKSKPITTLTAAEELFSPMDQISMAAGNSKETSDSVYQEEMQQYEIEIKELENENKGLELQLQQHEIDNLRRENMTLQNRITDLELKLTNRLEEPEHRNEGLIMSQQPNYHP